MSFFRLALHGGAGEETPYELLPFNKRKSSPKPPIDSPPRLELTPDENGLFPKPERRQK